MSKAIDCDTGPRCPYCGHVHGESEGWSGVVTLWGAESGPVDYECSACGLVFVVCEHVVRSWSSIPIVQPKVAANADP